MGKGSLTPPPSPILKNSLARVRMAEAAERDAEILVTLTKFVRVLTIPQIARTWWATAKNPAGATEQHLRSLVAEGLLDIERAPAHPEIELKAPVLSWGLDQPNPEFGPVSYKLQSRWTFHPELTPCVSATRKAANRFGGYASRPPRQVERTHDIHMGQVFLFYRANEPELLKFWVFEEQIKAERKRARTESSHGVKLPDAILRAPAGTRVVEFGGAYSKEKLQAFHAYCKENHFPYEVW